MRLSSLAVLVLVLVAGGVSACGSDDDAGGTASDPAGGGATSAPAEATSTLTVTRPDDSTFTIDGPFTAECLPSEDDPSVTLLRVLVPHPPGVEFLVEMDVAAVSPGTPYPLGQDEDGPVTLFFVDLADETELASDTEETSGTLTVAEASCDSQPHLEMSVDATLGAENADVTMAIAGDLTATAG